MKYVIEHLEPKLYKWCLLEYEHISGIVGKNNLIITNVKSKSKLRNIALSRNIFKKSFASLGLKNACIMSPDARKTLKCKDSKKFGYLVFGGILGDNPPKKRTSKYFDGLKYEKRNLGARQMSTDTAVYVAKNIVNGKRLKDFKFADSIDIQLDSFMSVTLPFRYVIVKNKILLPKGLVEYLNKINEP